MEARVATVGRVRGRSGLVRVEFAFYSESAARTSCEFVDAVTGSPLRGHPAVAPGDGGRPLDSSRREQPLDEVIAARVPGVSRRLARILIELGAVSVTGARVEVL